MKILRMFFINPQLLSAANVFYKIIEKIFSKMAGKICILMRAYSGGYIY